MIKQLDLYNLCEANKYEEIAETLHIKHYYNEEDSRHYLYYGETFTNKGILFGVYSSTSSLELRDGYFLGKNLSTNKNAFIGVVISNALEIYNLDAVSSFNTYSSSGCYNSNYSCSLIPLIFEKDSTTILVETAYLINVGPLSKIEAFNFRMNDKIYTRMKKPNPASTGAFWNIVIEDIE